MLSFAFVGKKGGMTSFHERDTERWTRTLLRRSTKQVPNSKERLLLYEFPFKTGAQGNDALKPHALTLVRQCRNSPALQNSAVLLYVVLSRQTTVCCAELRRKGILYSFNENGLDY